LPVIDDVKPADPLVEPIDLADHEHVAVRITVVEQHR